MQHTQISLRNTNCIKINLHSSPLKKSGGAFWKSAPTFASNLTQKILKKFNTARPWTISPIIN
ncbi:hypothetical protein [Chromobacterium sphagni]|uniref:hypothetical protein n=1 Tax=Chromobacterium sphagni TaxID=1903179 RepID=UPI0011134AC6|nr:hypothetical protein [Chromobacterium sphagni]